MTALDYVKNCIKRDFPEDVSEILTMFVDDNMKVLRSAEPAGQQADSESRPDTQAAGAENPEGEAATGVKNTEGETDGMQILEVMYPFIALMQAYSQILKDEAVVKEYCDVLVEAAPEEIRNVMLSLQG